MRYYIWKALRQQKRQMRLSAKPARKPACQAPGAPRRPGGDRQSQQGKDGAERHIILLPADDGFMPHRIFIIRQEQKDQADAGEIKADAKPHFEREKTGRQTARQNRPATVAAPPASRGYSIRDPDARARLRSWRSGWLSSATPIANDLRRQHQTCQALARTLVRPGISQRYAANRSRDANSTM